MMWGQPDNPPGKSLPARTGTPCCTIGDLELDVEFFSGETVWNECSVVAGVATLFYPFDDNTPGTVEVCISFLGTNEGADIRGNDLLNGGIGLQFGNPAIDNDPTFTGPQVHRGNEWIGPFQGYAAVFFNADFNDQLSSRFTVKSGADPDYLPSSFNSGVASWFLDQNGSSIPTYQCPTGQPPVPNFDGIKEVTEIVTQGQYPNSTDWLATNWLADSRVLRAESLGEIEILEHANWIPWRSSQSKQVVGEFQEIEELIGDLHNITDSESAALDNTENSVETMQRDYAISTIELYNDNSSTAEADRTNQLNLLDLQHDTLLTRYQNLEAVAGERIKQAKAKNSVLTSSLLPAVNQKDMNSVNLAALEFGMSSLDLQDEQLIVSIAEQCPYNGGEAVYQARAFASALALPLTINANDNCSTGKKLTIESPPQTVQIKVYPNPTEDHFKYESKENPVSEISIANIKGEVVFSMAVSTKAGMTGRVKLPELAPGTYAIMFTLTNGLTITEKIIVK